MANVAVIGAGLSGLVTVKELVAQGHTVRCFEQNTRIGGVFAGRSSYDAVTLTTSNYFMAYSDHMPRGEPVRFWTKAEYQDYLHHYAERFGLYAHLQLGVKVVSATRCPARTWELELLLPNGEQQRQCVDKLAICSGQFQRAQLPEVVGLETFPGSKLHSAQYHNTESPVPLRGKRVLCFGVGESGADVVTEIAEVASRTVLVLRRKHVFSPRYVASRPIDVAQTRFHHSLPVEDKARAVRNLWKELARGGDPATVLAAEHVVSATDEPGSVVTKSERIFHAQAYHGLHIEVGAVRGIQGSRVEFASGLREDFDALVFCTGYQLTWPFLEDALRVSDMRHCHLQMFHPASADSLAFVGFVRPQQGGIPLIAELQARYLALVWSGQRVLPANLAGSARSQATQWQQEFYATPHVAGLVNGLRYNEQLAELIGCRPPMPNPLAEPRHYLAYWFHHVWPCQYRLVGPGADPQARTLWLGAPSNERRYRQLKNVVKMGRYRLRGLLTADPHRKWRPLVRAAGRVTGQASRAASFE